MNTRQTAALAYVTAQLLDIATTAVILRPGIVELNPFVNMIGWGPSSLLKILAMGAVVLAGYLPRWVPAWFLWLWVAGAALPVVNNLVVMVRLG